MKLLNDDGDNFCVLLIKNVLFFVVVVYWFNSHRGMKYSIRNIGINIVVTMYSARRMPN